MDRFIDTVMIGSERIDERARLITRLCDTVAPLVGDLGGDTPALVRGALLATMRQAHARPLDVVADVLDRLSESVGVVVTWRTATLAPGEALALGVCDGRGLTDFALGAAVGVDRDEVAVARDRARLDVGLPPAPPACTRRHADLGDADTCAACMLVRADGATATARVRAEVGVPGGIVMDRVVERAHQWQAAVMRPRLRPVPGGPSPWTAMARLGA